MQRSCSSILLQTRVPEGSHTGTVWGVPVAVPVPCVRDCHWRWKE